MNKYYHEDFSEYNTRQSAGLIKIIAPIMLILFASMFIIYTGIILSPIALLVVYFKKPFSAFCFIAVGALQYFLYARFGVYSWQLVLLGAVTAVGLFFLLRIKACSLVLAVAAPIALAYAFYKIMRELCLPAYNQFVQEFFYGVIHGGGILESSNVKPLAIPSAAYITVAVVLCLLMLYRMISAEAPWILPGGLAKGEGSAFNEKGLLGDGEEFLE
ncbi:MAG: hypothetical protein LBU36_00380 [Clostridiales bacterium]|jgi:hypothetical protein|nr:hypothetical protein [Clostridiales bacterium]